jgi:hypothetical protein
VSMAVSTEKACDENCLCVALYYLSTVVGFVRFKGIDPQTLLDCIEFTSDPPCLCITAMCA